jgi:hypothetical protein
MLGEEIKRKVVVKLEEVSPYAPDHEDVGPLLSGQDRLDEIKPIYSYIEDTLPQAANEILLVAPLDKIETERADRRCCAHLYESHVTGDVYTICLPDDFLRLRALRLNTWTQTVNVAEHPATPRANAQENEWTMGLFTKPVVVLDESKLYCYSVKHGEECTVKEFRYIPFFSEAGEYSENIAELIALNCAKKIYEIFQNTEGVNAMANEIKSAMEALAL